MVKNEENEIFAIMTDIPMSDSEMQQSESFVAIDIPKKSTIEQLKKNLTAKAYLRESVNLFKEARTLEKKGYDKLIVAALFEVAIMRFAKILTNDQVACRRFLEKRLKGSVHFESISLVLYLRNSLYAHSDREQEFVVTELGFSTKDGETVIRSRTYNTQVPCDNDLVSIEQLVAVSYGLLSECINELETLVISEFQKGHYR